MTDIVERLRRTLPGIQTDDMGDNLAITLASDFEKFCASEELDDSGTWKQEAIDKTNRLFDAIHAHYSPEITRLRALVEEMGKALEPFALHAECWPHEQDFDLLTTSDEDGNAASRDFTVGDLRRARATLAKAKE